MKKLVLFLLISVVAVESGYAFIFGGGAWRRHYRKHRRGLLSCVESTPQRVADYGDAEFYNEPTPKWLLEELRVHVDVHLDDLGFEVYNRDSSEVTEKEWKEGWVKIHHRLKQQRQYEKWWQKRWEDFKRSVPDR